MYSREDRGTIFYLGNSVYFGVKGHVIAINKNDNIVITNDGGTISIYDLEKRSIMSSFNCGSNKHNSRTLVFDKDIYLITPSFERGIGNGQYVKVADSIFNFKIPWWGVCLVLVLSLYIFNLLYTDLMNAMQQHPVQKVEQIVTGSATYKADKPFQFNIDEGRR
jgi:hypothetical protein